MPQCKITIYCTFRSERITRIPDDGIYIYSIFQKAVDNDEFIDARTNKEKERVARKVLKFLFHSYFTIKKFIKSSKKCFENIENIVYHKYIIIFLLIRFGQNIMVNVSNVFVFRLVLNHDDRLLMNNTLIYIAMIYRVNYNIQQLNYQKRKCQPVSYYLLKKCMKEASVK